jgi:hypothetical protein
MRKSMTSAGVVALFLALAGAGAHAQDGPACDKFKWSVERERGWFGDVASVDSGAVIVANRGYAVALQPTDAVVFRVTPERAPRPDTFGAMLDVANAGAPGLYQITLSDDAWIDVVQEGARLPSVAFTGQKDCPGARKSVRFALKAGGLTIQISNAPTAAINLAIAPAQ